MTCPPIILDPVESCDNNNGSGQGNGCGSGTVTLSIRQNGTLNYNVDVSYNSNDTGVQATGVNSYISGVTLGVSWTQNSVSQNVNGNTIEFEVNGTLNYNIVFEGIGTVYKRRTTLKGTYDPCGNNGGGSGGIEEFLQTAN